MARSRSPRRRGDDKNRSASPRQRRPSPSYRDAGRRSRRHDSPRRHDSFRRDDEHRCLHVPMPKMQQRHAYPAQFCATCDARGPEH